MNSLYVYLFVALFLFCIGLWGVLHRRSLIAMLISVELMLNAASINFMAFNHFLLPDTVHGQIMTLFVIGLAAAEATLFLSIVVSVYRRYQSVNIEQVAHLRG